MIKVIITGANGKMGRNLLKAIALDKRFLLVGAFLKEDDLLLGQNVQAVENCEEFANLDLKFTALSEEIMAKCDLIIDFSTVEATLKTLEICQKLGKKMVIGTTGFNQEQKEMITKAAEKTAIVFASNYSVGVNLVFKLLEKAAKVMNDCDIEIIEAHHNKKIDAPSGTALSMGEHIAKTLGKDLQKDGVFSRGGIIGARKKGEIGFSTIRGGDVVGEHQAWFLDEGERVEIAHKASSRMTFAKGALRAGVWLNDKEKGLFDMTDVLALNDL